MYTICPDASDLDIVCTYLALILLIRRCYLLRVLYDKCTQRSFLAEVKFISIIIFLEMSQIAIYVDDHS